jgi:hypothetical protein
MRTKAISKPNEKQSINWALPNQTVSHKAFLKSIKEAEDGSFITVEEFEQRFDVWKQKNGL